MKKKTSILLLIIVGLFTLTGCEKVPKIENGKDAVVTLNGDDISVDDLYNEMKSKYALSVLLDMTDTQILNDKYEDTKEQKESIEAQIKSWVSQFGDEQTFLQQTQASWGISTMDGVRDYLKLQYKKQLAVEDYAKDMVSKDEINKYYDEKIFGDISAKHILIKPVVNDNMSESEKTAAEEEALKKAKEVITKLKNGEEFDNLAKEYSDDESNKDKGGLLSDFVHGTMVTEFEEAAVKLENGTYTTEPVKTAYGYHIIYKVSQKEKPELKTVKDDIIEDIAKEKMSTDANISIDALEQLRKDYKVEIQDDTLKTQYENYLRNAKNN